MSTTPILSHVNMTFYLSEVRKEGAPHTHGCYDVHPSSRPEIIQTDEWRSDVVYNYIYFQGGLTDKMSYHKVETTTVSYYENLKGSQETIALWELVHNKMVFHTKRTNIHPANPSINLMLSEINGLAFTDWPYNHQVTFGNLSVLVDKFEYMFTPENVAVCGPQQTTSPKIGEKLNQLKSKFIIKKINALIHTLKANDLFVKKGNPDRKEALYRFTSIAYTFFVDQSNHRLQEEKVLVGWVDKSGDTISTTEWDKYEKLIKMTYEICKKYKGCINCVAARRNFEAIFFLVFKNDMPSLMKLLEKLKGNNKIRWPTVKSETYDSASKTLGSDRYTWLRDVYCAN